MELPKINQNHFADEYYRNLQIEKKKKAYQELNETLAREAQLPLGEKPNAKFIKSQYYEFLKCSKSMSQTNA